MPVMQERRKNPVIQPEKKEFDYAANGKNNPWGLRVYYFLILAALEVVMAFSWFGFVSIEPISITLLHIPVLIGALFFGPWMGAAVGGVFGVLSMWKATYLSFTAADAVFSPFTSPDPFGSIVVSLLARIAFGFIAGLLYEKAKGIRPEWLVISVVTFLAAGVHSFLVLGATHIFFPELGLDIASDFMLLGKINGVIYCGSAMITVPPLYMLAKHTLAGKRMAGAIAASGHMFCFTSQVKRLLIFFVVMTLIVFSLVMHLVNRIQFLLAWMKFNLDAQFSQMIFDVSMQFVVGVTALSFLLFIMFLYFYDRSYHATDLAEHDPLTGVFNHAAAAEKIGALMQGNAYHGEGTFIIMDIDDFKEINDHLGHPFGDMVLQRVGKALQGAVRHTDIVGRLGGDEFCIYLPGKMDTEVLQQRISGLFRLHETLYMPAGHTFTWSFGIVRAVPGSDFDSLYRKADTALYVSKHEGKNQYHYYDQSAS